jgi:hypothetical protein
MADTKEKLRHLFRELVKDTSNKNRCRIQYEIIKEYRGVKESSNIVLEAWVQELYTKYPQYMPPIKAPITESIKAPITESIKKPITESIKKPIQAPGVVKVVRRITLINGDCFFSSIFRAANDQGILDKIITCLFASKPPKTELDFVKLFRHMLAKRVLKGKLPKALDERTGKEQDTYEVLYEAYHKAVPGMVDVRVEDKKTMSTYRQILSAFPNWFEQEFKNGLPDRNTFLREVADGIDTMENWVGTIEVEMTSYLLQKNCGIVLKYYYGDLREAARMDSEGRPILHLKNNGEAHWEYYSFDVKQRIKYPFNGSFVVGSRTKGGSRRTRKKSRSV